MKKCGLILLVVCLSSGCDDADKSKGGDVKRDVGSADPRNAQDPTGSASLMELDDETIGDTLAYASVEIDQWRSAGVDKMVSELKKALASKVDVSVLDKINDSYIGTPLQRKRTDTSKKTQGLSQRHFALGASEIEQHFDCPVLAPEQNEGTSCDNMVDSILVTVKEAMEQQQGEIEVEIAEGYDFPELSTQFISLWAAAAQQYGADVAAIYAKQELYAAAECDNKENATIVSFTLGRQQGVSIVETYREWAIEQVKSCVINTDTIAERVREMSIEDIEEFMTEHKVCADVDLSPSNKTLKEAEIKREEGIRKGIDERVEILRQELFETRRTTNCCGYEDETVEPIDPEPEEPLPANECDVGGDCGLVPHNEGKWREVKNNCVCCRRRRATSLIACKGPTNPPLYCGENTDGSFYCQCKSIPLGSPIVVDLDGDGLDLSTKLVSFDLLAAGNKQRCTWVGKTEGLVVLDHDRDGDISSSQELFGNLTRCENGLCNDGVAALKQWDKRSRGGNADGMLDKHDLIFARLQIWVDKNHDGRSQPDELQSLAEAGVQSFNLDADYDVQRRAEGSITAQLDVLTTNGFRRAYDVWFKVKVTPNELAELLPY